MLQAVHSSLEPCSPTHWLSLLLLHIIHIIEVHQGNHVSTAGGILRTDNASIGGFLHHLHLTRRAHGTSHHCSTKYKHCYVTTGERARPGPSPTSSQTFALCNKLDYTATYLLFLLLLLLSGSLTSQDGR